MYIGNSSIIDEVCNILKAIHKLTRECIVQSEHLLAFLLFFLRVLRLCYGSQRQMSQTLLRCLLGFIYIANIAQNIL